MAADVQAKAVLLRDYTLSGTFTTSDNVTLEDGDRVLAARQGGSTENDLYIVNSGGVWPRDTATPLSTPNKTGWRVG